MVKICKNWKKFLCVKLEFRIWPTSRPRHKIVKSDLMGKTWTQSLKNHFISMKIFWQSKMRIPVSRRDIFPVVRFVVFSHFNILNLNILNILKFKVNCKDFHYLFHLSIMWFSFSYKIVDQQIFYFWFDSKPWGIPFKPEVSMSC